jgi:hypothetical protein
VAAARVADRPDRSQPSSASNHARYIGRIGALAVALGIGVAIGSTAVASADTGESTSSSGGSTTDRGDTTSSRRASLTGADQPRNEAGPRMPRLSKRTGDTASTATTARSQRRIAELDTTCRARSDAPTRPLSSTPDTGAATDTATETPASHSPRSLRAPRTARLTDDRAGEFHQLLQTTPNTAAATGTRPLAADPTPPAPTARSVIDPATAVTNLIQLFIGNGTAAHPDAGLLLGNGFS